MNAGLRFSQHFSGMNGTGFPGFIGTGLHFSKHFAGTGLHFSQHFAGMNGSRIQFHSIQQILKPMQFHSIQKNSEKSGAQFHSIQQNAGKSVNHFHSINAGKMETSSYLYIYPANPIKMLGKVVHSIQLNAGKMKPISNSPYTDSAHRCHH